MGFPCSPRALLASALLLAPMLTSACQPGATGRAVRPAEMTAWEATGDQAGQCRMVSSFGEPLVVDWEAHQRANIEEAMNDGVAVVAYDCKSLRLLKGCRIDGSYGFMAVSKKEQVVRFEDADEVAANLPTFGLPLVRQLRGDLSRDSTLDLAMILVGKRRTTVSEAGREKLVGAAACEGATHFVRGAFVGAFTMGTGTKGEASLGMGLFAASSRSSKLGKYRDGEAESCQQVTPGQPSPPASCSALLRLELVGLTPTKQALAEEPRASGSKPAERSAGQVCPAGLVLAAGKCTRPGANQAHQCAPRDVIECQAQCDLGHPGSCSSLGLLYEKGQGVTADMARAASLYRKACDGGEADGCIFLGDMHEQGKGVTADMARAASLYQKACDSGDAGGCTFLGVMYADGKGVTADTAHAASLHQRSCDGGDPAACVFLGRLYIKGDGVPLDPARAASLYRKGCDGGKLHGCAMLGLLYQGNQGIDTDIPAAVRLHRQACRGGVDVSCRALQKLGEAP